jgi:DNA-binding transcriptional regulator LsrR (DeoR family)
LDDQSVDVLIDVATRYYLHGSSQIDIARELKLDPSTISRYLKRARDDGIVRIEIVAPRRQNAQIARRVADALGLSRAIVAELHHDQEAALPRSPPWPPSSPQINCAGERALGSAGGKRWPR